MAKSGFLSREEIANNIRALQTFMSKNKIDVFYLSSNDIFLNEYVPLSDCHRYYVTGFTGSTAECLVPRVGKVQLFVDGRYHEQADLEVDLEKIEVVKVEMSVGNRQSVLKQIAQKKYRTLAFEANRIDVQFADSFKKNSLQIIEFHRNELQSVIPFQTEVFEKKLIEISTKLTGESTLEKLRKILKPNEAFFITALDSIAWLTNMRRYELPFQSTFKSKALATYDRVYLLMEGYEGKVSNPHVEIFVDRFEATDVFLASIFEVEALLGGNKLKVETLYFSEALTNESDAQLLKKLFKSAQIINKTEGIIPFHAYKNPVELESIKASFNLADQAIFNTLKKVKNQLKQNLSMTEKDLFNWCNDEYQKVGALAQSFNTIAGVGANSSIIHYSASSDQVVVKNETLMLLDSGGYFESGYATDTTRTILSGGRASEKQKEIYTLVLKSLLNIQNAIFPVGTVGGHLDGVARQPLYQAGYDYKHGTGHGVGINVHEGGFRLSPSSMIPIKENTIGSIEPGIYVPGFGGVRLENIVIVKKHPTFENMLCFESLVYVGFDHDLINFDLLTEIEKKWLDQYEAECRARNRSFV